jgi:hypothetical protein
MYVTMQTVDEHELVHGPADRFNRVLFDAAVRIQDGDVRSEFPLRQTPQTSSRQRDAKHPSKRSQPLYALVTNEDKRPTARPAPKAGRAIEPELKRLHLHVRGSLACDPNDLIGQLTEKEQRDVQQLWFDYFAIEFVGAFERMRQPVNPHGRIGIRNDRKE